MDIEAAVAEAALQGLDATVTGNLTVTEYVLVAALTGWDDAGDQITAVSVVNSDAPNHRLLGLVETARARYRVDALDPDDG